MHFVDMVWVKHDLLRPHGDQVQQHHDIKTTIVATTTTTTTTYNTHINGKSKKANSGPTTNYRRVQFQVGFLTYPAADMKGGQ